MMYVTYELWCKLLKFAIAMQVVHHRFSTAADMPRILECIVITTDLHFQRRQQITLLLDGVGHTRGHMPT